MTTTYKVTGMTCGGCAKSVETAIKSVAPSAQVSADAASGLVKVEGATEAQVSQAVDDAGFSFVGKQS